MPPHRESRAAKASQKIIHNAISSNRQDGHDALQEAALLAGTDSICACNAILNRCQRLVSRGTLHGAMQGQHY
jgi:hypothetical protein